MCIALFKWDMMIFKQMVIEKEPSYFSKFTNMLSSEKTKKANDSDSDEEESTPVKPVKKITTKNPILTKILLSWFFLFEFLD